MDGIGGLQNYCFLGLMGKVPQKNWGYANNSNPAEKKSQFSEVRGQNITGGTRNS